MKTDVLTKVQKLLAKAEGCSTLGTAEGENEAAVCMAKAQELITEHAIDEAMLHPDTPGVVTSMSIQISGPYAIQKCSLLHVVSQANRVNAVIVGKTPDAGRKVVMVGFQSDIDATRMLFESLLLQLDRAVGAYKFPPPTPRVVITYRGREWQQGTRQNQIRSFMIGFTNRIGDRLDDARQRAEKNAQGTQTGSRVALVLKDRSALVDQAFGEQFPDVRESYSQVSVEHGAAGAGAAAANSADLGQQRVAQRRSLPK